MKLFYLRVVCSPMDESVLRLMLKYLFIFLFIVLWQISFAQPVTEQLLNSNWQFRKVGDKEWLPATVPGTVHTDLLANKKIPDPFLETNEKDLQWIEDADWEYETAFSIDSTFFNQSFCEIEFSGLDTYAKVFLNNSLILNADNMFRWWKADCKKYLKIGENLLFIRFESAVMKAKVLAKQLPYTLPGDDKVFTRKAQYQFGWDWAPRFVTCGIWREVKLIAYPQVRIENIKIVADELSNSKAMISVHAEFSGKPSASEIHFSVYNKNDKRQRMLAETIINAAGHASLNFEIKNPQLWQCNGIGNPYLYEFVFEVSEETKNILDREEIKFGLRTIELVQENDSHGKSFYFKLNRNPVFMKGANWIPADNFLPRVSKGKYLELLVNAKEANMNMLRVWGGGVYEDDYFYSLCDSLGILVWQDFMFACAMYPGDSDFVKNVSEEVKDNIKRLRNHPCIALWCGNNEIDEGWKNWGWKEQLECLEKDSIKIYDDYKNLFRKIIPDIVKDVDSTRAYWESSPSIGWGHKESLEQGNSHYWGVWWGMEPFSAYEKKTGRFMSEYGFQGMPSLSTFRKFCGEKDLTLISDAVKNHQKHPAGYETIQKYLERDYKQPKDFESYIYVSQVMQAEGIKKAIEAHRMAKPRCMGTLYWQLNDCWPVTSWSSMDYYNKPKALQYAVKKAYTKYFICAEINDSNLVVNVISDDTTNVDAIFRIRLTDFTGNILWRDSGKVTPDRKGSAAFYPLLLEDMLRDISEYRVFFRMELLLNGKVVSENVRYFLKPKDLLFDKPQIQYSIASASPEIYSLTLFTNSLAKNVFLDFGDESISLSDNYFDLFPKEQKVILVFSDASVEALKEKIKIKSLVDSY
ncbi:MAG TPA: glycoside hydrolase family 2 protein [Bacteroidia bacterium]|nr:glycoside hydrolase family 2 protein [Bacteroidia bacterium]